jgi:DNA-binding transcriptional MocR family regulator
MWISKIELSKGELRYRAIADAIRDAIQAGDLQPGDLLPTHRAMAERLGVTVGTISRAYSVVADWGLVSARVGSGTLVRGRDVDEVTNPWVIGQPGNRIEFGLLYPAGLTDVALRDRCFGRPFEGLGRDLLGRAFTGYSPELGHPSHRATGADWLSRAGVVADASEVFVTDGGQSAFMTLLTGLLHSGGVLLVEELPYLGIKHLCTAMRINAVTVPIDSEGMIPERLKECARASGARLVLITPTLQNPTGARMGLERRQQIIDVVREAGLQIIEDATFDRLYPDAPPALVTLAPERTFYVASFSKMALPAMRVAFVKAPAHKMPLFESVRHSLNIGGPSLQAEVVSRWIQAGLVEEVCQWQRTEIDRRWKMAVEKLPNFVVAKAIPAPFAWLPLPNNWRSIDFAGHLREMNVIVIEARHFVIGRANAPDAIRISLTSPASDGMLVQGLEIIQQLLDSDPISARLNFR